jgi:hypothetical protein
VGGGGGALDVLNAFLNSKAQMGVALAVVVAAAAYSSVNEPPLPGAVIEGAVVEAAANHGGWLPDPSPDAGGLDPAGGPLAACTIDVAHARDFDGPEDFARLYRGLRPVLVEGLLDAWPARATWTRDGFQARFGGRTVGAGGGANIVMSGGRGGHEASTVAAYLDTMAATTKAWPDTGEASATAAAGAAAAAAAAGKDVFNFDPDFLGALPELAGDFEVPALFQDWAGVAKRGVSGQAPPGGSPGGAGAWSILSLGASRTGLPFHVHGEVRSAHMLHVSDLGVAVSRCRSPLHLGLVSRHPASLLFPLAPPPPFSPPLPFYPGPLCSLIRRGWAWCTGPRGGSSTRRAGTPPRPCSGPPPCAAP